tara:strand:+ start:95 stop:565 length:471 start_codon:yes stop_codon:yes gene_type:complete
MDDKKGVEALYNIIDSLNEELLSNPFVNKVTVGRLTEIDLAKNTIFPLSHIMLNSIRHNENTLSFNLSIYNLDIVNISKEAEIGVYGNDNTMYILSNQLYVINRLLSRLKQSTIYKDGWELDGNPDSDVIDKEMENMLTGYQTDITINVPNDISKC